MDAEKLAPQRDLVACLIRIAATQPQRSEHRSPPFLNEVKDPEVPYSVSAISRHSMIILAASARCFDHSLRTRSVDDYSLPHGLLAAIRCAVHQDPLRAQFYISQPDWDTLARYRDNLSVAYSLEHLIHDAHVPFMALIKSLSRTRLHSLRLSSFRYDGSLYQMEISHWMGT